MKMGDKNRIILIRGTGRLVQELEGVTDGIIQHTRRVYVYKQVSKAVGGPG